MTVHAKVGVVIEINGTKIPFEPSTAIDQISDHGFKVGLPQGMRVDLGTAEGGIEAVVKTFDPDFSMPTIPTEIPEPFHGWLTSLEEAEFYLESMDLELTHDSTPDKWQKKYRLGLSINFPLKRDTGLAGISLEVSNMDGGADSRQPTTKKKIKGGKG